MKRIDAFSLAIVAAALLAIPVCALATGVLMLAAASGALP